MRAFLATQAMSRLDIDLGVAVSLGNVADAKVLIAQGANVNAKRQGRTLVTIAAEEGDLETFKALVGAGAKLRKDSEGRGVMHRARLFKGPEGLALARTFLDRGMDVDVKDKAGFTPLTFAALQGDRELCAFLLSRGADLGAQAKGTFDPVTAAACSDHFELVNDLLHWGEVNGRHIARPLQSIKNSALLAMCERDNVDMARFLMERGADPTAVGLNGSTGLHVAARNGCENVIDLLCKDKSVLGMIDARNANGNAPLHLAMLRCGTPGIFRSLDASRVLIGLGADIDALDANGATALHLAATAGSLEMCAMLIQMGADATIKANGVTAAGAAARRQNRALSDVIKGMCSARDALAAVDVMLQSKGSPSMGLAAQPKMAA